MPETLAMFTASLGAAGVLAKHKALEQARKTVVPASIQFARNDVPQDRPLTVTTITGKAYIKQDLVTVELRAKGAALFLEFGTVKMPPHPFMLPALRKSQAPYAELLADIGEEVLGG